MWMLRHDADEKWETIHSYLEWLKVTEAIAIGKF